MIVPVEYRTVSDEKHKPVPDEQTLGKLLEAAYVIQEHNREMLRLELRPGVKREQAKAGDNSSPAQKPSPQAKSPQPAPLPDNASTLAKIVQTQHQIQFRRLEFQTALKLVAERVCEMTNASGAAIAIIDGKNAHYRAVFGRSTPVSGKIVALDQAMFAPCLNTGQVFRCADANAEFLLDVDECKRRGIQSLIAVPVFHDGGVAGGLELYYGSPNAFTEQNVHTCQLMASLVAEALVREEEAAWKKSLASERAAMLEALEKLQPNLAALVEKPVSKNSSPAEKVSRSAPTHSYCRCGNRLMAEEQFCGQCGTPRAGDYETSDMQRKVASLWQLQEAQKNETGSETEPAEKPAPVASREIAAVEDEEGPTEADELSAESPDHSQALAKPKFAHPADWSSASSARVFLERFVSSKRTGRLVQLWNAHRGDIYLGVAVILVACVIRWGLWSSHPVKATATPAAATATPRKPAPDPGLSFFDRMLIQLGLAEAPEPPEDKGNPGVQVWVDLHTALYYCPGTDLYGKTPQGKFTTQREAQLDQFEPAYRKACN